MRKGIWVCRGKIERGRYWKRNKGGEIMVCNVSVGGVIESRFSDSFSQGKSAKVK